MTLSKLFIPAALATFLSILFLDRSVSLFVSDTICRSAVWTHLTSDLPDLLLLFVVAVSIAAYLGSCCLRCRRDDTGLLLRHVALSLPAAYLAKSLLKPLFGRVTTRYWLSHPESYQFRWLAGGPGFDGFPSGHMLVFVALLAAIARYRPAARPRCFGLLALLALALVATNYHFVSDVICGAYLGLAVEAGVARFGSQSGIVSGVGRSG